MLLNHDWPGLGRAKARYQPRQSLRLDQNSLSGAGVVLLDWPTSMGMWCRIPFWVIAGACGWGQAARSGRWKKIVLPMVRLT